MDVELSGRRMYESYESTVNRLCNGAKKGDQFTRCRSKNPKYDIVTKVEKFFEGHDWLLGKQPLTKNRIIMSLYEDGDREECAEKDLSDILLTHDLAKVTVGSQVAVHWPDDDDNYEATVVTEQNWSKTLIELECDSGHFKW
eukprot:CAMPEP_0202509952 /NCGR_PEP_ID=MMETSP1361-20130828/53040_1 /ASSEMBLY_ACC=CAM_ASM_000849 /TAXON_ID=210615 /ORGANISM="Staurosira complex sp., Strain CCMP2646" /LENGTH=141 /DNA_ID=CAMNT_0049144193 /DNA_START=998 /DNA_END=1419 /DNA_ORIENTATION=-